MHSSLQNCKFVKKLKMSLENTQAQMRKGILEYCILSIIKHKKEAYPSEILETLKEAKLIVVEGTLYPLLNYRWEESTSGPPRKYYALTKIGQAFLEELSETWVELNLAVNTITKN